MIAITCIITAAALLLWPSVQRVPLETSTPKPVARKRPRTRKSKETKS